MPGVKLSETLTKHFMMLPFWLRSREQLIGVCDACWKADGDFYTPGGGESPATPPPPPATALRMALEDARTQPEGKIFAPLHEGADAGLINVLLGGAYLMHLNPSILRYSFLLHGFF